jgi:hypothetical protein
VSDCPNCGRRLGGRYCAECGQKAGPVNPTVGDFAHDLTHQLLHVDGKIFQSVRLLLTKPGFLSREYFLGRRAGYVNPIRLYLIFSIIFFALAVGRIEIGPDDISAIQQVFPDMTYEAATERLLQAETWFPRIMFLLVPFGAWLVQLATRSSGRNYPQHLYFALHTHAAYFAAETLTTLLHGLDLWLLSTLAEIAQTTYGAWYVLTAFRTAYGGSWRRAAVRGAFVVASYSTVVSLILFVVITYALA